MNPNQTCEIILAYLKKSNLNFSLVESPFGVNIYIKKTFIKDKNGVLRSSGISDQSIQFLQENHYLKNLVNDQLHEIVNYQNAVQKVGISLEKAKLQIEEVLTEKNEVKSAKDSIENALSDKIRENIYLNDKLQQQAQPCDLNQNLTAIPSLLSTNSSSPL